MGSTPIVSVRQSDTRRHLRLRTIALRPRASLEWCTPGLFLHRQRSLRLAQDVRMDIEESKTSGQSFQRCQRRIRVAQMEVADGVGAVARICRPGLSTWPRRTRRPLSRADVPAAGARGGVERKAVRYPSRNHVFLQLRLRGERNLA